MASSFVTDDALIVSGERQRNQESDEGGIHRTERHYGHFYRAVPLRKALMRNKFTRNLPTGF